jgi:hypothetical protein
MEGLRMKTELRRLVAHFAKSDGSKEAAGRAGELFARKWFEREHVEYFRFPQSHGTKPSSLAALGGKRPDFAVAMQDVDSLVYVDAKFHRTNNLTEFVLEEAELNQFRAFREWIRDEYEDTGDRNVLFMLYPKENNGDKFVWVHLDEFSNAESVVLEGKPARKVSLKGRDGLWVDNVAIGA